ncbi:MAG: elongation factor G [Fidelibacterota bacterium]
MKQYATADIRNFALVGHGASGKTCLSEAMLYNSKQINRMGTIEDGNTVSDYHPGEQTRQISIHATPLVAEWDNVKFNIIDTPGYADFIGEALSSLAVVDMAAVVISAVNGVEVGTEQIWQHASKNEIPKIIIVNGLDREHVNFNNILKQCKERFGQNVFPMQMPVTTGPGFHKVIDVLRSELIEYELNGSGNYTESKLPDDLQAQVNELHQSLIEHVAESDDSLLEKFFDQGNLSEEEMRHGIHAAVQNQTFIPLFCTASTTNIGVARLMDFISKYGASPVDRAQISALNANNDEEQIIDLSGKDPILFVYKTIAEGHVGELSFFRVYSGRVRTGEDMYNTDRDQNERFGQLFLMNGKERSNIGELATGDLGAVVKLKDTHSGNTLCGNGIRVKLKNVVYPNPNIHAAIEIHSKGDEEKVAVGLSTLHEEDPTFIYKVDSELKQTVISGQGELHLQVLHDRLKRRFGVDITLKEPKIPYRETIFGKGESKYRHKKQSGGAGQFAEVWMRVEPKKRGEGVEFSNSLVGQNVDRVFVPSVEKGVNAACTEGVLAGYRVVDLKVNFYDGKQHPVDSKDIAFQIAGKHAFREAFLQAQPGILEPIINIEVKVPEDHMGDVMGDISGRRGKIMGMESEGSMQIIKAQVPQGNLYNYSTTLRSLTGGRALHSEEFSHYEQMPKDMEKKVVAASKKEEE